MASDRGSARSFVGRYARALVVSIALLIGLVWVLRAGALPLLPPAGTFEHTDFWGVLAMALLLLASTLLRFARCHFLLAPIAVVPMKRLISMSCVAFGLLTFLPLRLGEVARPAMLREKGKLSGWAVTGTVGAERVIDGIVFSSSLLLGLWLAKPNHPLPDRIGELPVPAALVPRAAELAALAFGAAFVAMAVFYFWRALARRLTERVLGVISNSFASRVADAIERLSDGFRFLPDFRHSLPFVAATVLALLVQALGLLALGRAVGLAELTFTESLVVLGVLGLGVALPNAPGFFGSIQLALYAGLAVYVAPERVVHEGAAFVFLFYAVYIAEVVLLTLYGIVVEYREPASAAAARAPSP